MDFQIADYLSCFLIADYLKKNYYGLIMEKNIQDSLASLAR